MKIIQIGSFPLDVSCIKGGVEASIYGLATELVKNHTLTVIDIPRTDLRNDKIEIINGIKIFRFSSPLKSNVSGVIRLKNIIKSIREQSPDICHIHTTSLISFLIFIILKFYKIPSIVTVHGLAHIEKKNIWNKKKNIINFVKYNNQSITEFLFISICKILIVDTQYVAETIKIYKKQHKILSLPDCKVIPQGINPIFFQIVNSSKNNQLLSVGAITNRKGHLGLIDSMTYVKELYPNFKLTIVGALSDQRYLQLMQNSIKEKGLESNIGIIPDVSFEKIVQLYENAEIFVLSTEEESQGIVFCEAMAAGKSIITTNVGGVPWVVKNNVNGLLSEYGDSNGFAKNVITLMENEKLRKQMEKSNKLDSLKYDWKHISEEIIEVYKSLM